MCGALGGVGEEGEGCDEGGGGGEWPHCGGIGRVERISIMYCKYKSMYGGSGYKKVMPLSASFRPLSRMALAIQGSGTLKGHGIYLWAIMIGLSTQGR